LVLYCTAIYAQKNDRMLACWVDKFPPWQEPWWVPVATVQRVSELFRYAAEPVGNVLLPLAIVGGIRLWQDGRRRLVAFLVVPVALNVLGWLLHSYPLDGSRVV